MKLTKEELEKKRTYLFPAKWDKTGEFILIPSHVPVKDGSLVDVKIYRKIK